jgi:hypothetical protein
MTEKTNLSPDAFLIMVNAAKEWSVASTGDELVLFMRYVEDGQIHRYFGPSKFDYAYRDLAVFTLRVKYKMMRARGKIGGIDTETIQSATEKMVQFADILKEGL